MYIDLNIQEMWITVSSTKYLTNKWQTFLKKRQVRFLFYNIRNTWNLIELGEKYICKYNYT